MYYSDYHLHTNFSHDGKASMEEMIQKGIELGLKEICFTEHHDADHPDVTFDNLVEYDRYIILFEDLKKKYKDKIVLKLGVEIGLQPHLVKQTEEFVRKYLFDFIIGSTHMVDSIDLGLNGAKFFEGVSQKEAYLRYFEDVLNSIRSYDDFDVYGHIDYIIRYGNYETKGITFDDYRDILDSILKSLIDKGKGIEINTSGYKYGVNQTHPNIDIIKRYKELGGEIITLGSDAHITEHMCYSFDKAYEILREVGFKYITSFDKRKMNFIKI